MNASPPAGSTVPAAGRPPWRDAFIWAGRAVWAIVSVAALVALLRGAWTWYDVNRRPCHDPVRSDWIYCPDFEQGLAQVGLTLAGFSAYTAALPVLAGLPFFVLSFIIMRRRSHWLLAVVTAVVLAAFGPFGRIHNPIAAWARSDQAWSIWLVDILYWILFGPGILVAYLFPDGRFVPGWTRWFSVIWILADALARLFPDTGLNFNQWPSPFGLLIGAAPPVSGLIAVLYRYRYVADAQQRQQIKWFVAGASLLIGLWLFDFAVWDVYTAITGEYLVRPGLPAVLWELADITIWSIAQLFFAVCLGFAFFRYRLWDIDLLIRRSLIYGALTATLALVYFGSVVLLQSVFRALTGQGQNSLVTVLSTLAIAALFMPVHRRVQNFIDKRFYRQKYEAQKVLAQFAATCRDETDLDKLTARLLEVVQETMQPEHVSLWLKTTEPLKRREH